MPKYIEEPNIDYAPDMEDEDDSLKITSIAKMVSKKKTQALVTKWLVNHGAEPHINKEISIGTGLDVSTVSLALGKLVSIGAVHRIRLDKIDKRSHLYTANHKIAELIVKRYLWLCSFQLLKTLANLDQLREEDEDVIDLDELRENSEFNQVMKKHGLSFVEAIEALKLNSYVEVLSDRAGEPYAIKLKENLPLQYFKQEKVEAKQAPEEVM